MSESLLPGITTITPRARYYSFYAWSLWDIQRGRDEVDQATGLYQRDRDYALACSLHEKIKRDHDTITGGGPARKQLSKFEGENKISTNFRHLQARRGGYDAYSSPISSLKILNAQYDPPKLTKIGKRLAESFEERVEETDYPKYVGKDKIPTEVLKQYAKRCCLCNLPSSAKERDILIRLLLDKSSPLRRGSLLGLLTLIREIDIDPRKLPTAFLDATYFQCCNSENGYVSINFPKNLEKVTSYWRVYRVDEYIGFAFRALFSAILRELDDKVLTPISEVKSRLSQSEIMDRFFSYDLELSRANFAALLKSLEKRKINLYGSADKEKPPIEKQIFRNLVDENPGSLSEVFADVLLMLAVVCHKNGDRWNADEWLWYRSTRHIKSGEEPNVYSIFRRLPPAEKDFTSFHEFLIKYILDRHEWRRINLTSGREMWVEIHDGRCKRIREYEPKMPSLRLNNASQILEDLGLYRGEGNVATLTDIGRKVLEGDVP
ncbi:hypothetical protein AKJ43_02205 [candidate division MSBL1 archaeon SCGC-AAA261D19]|nr:hypothetical protein AKJ43_02205 [candidate division MSBL1 archaeon SCGC-AAA261D19]